MKIDSENCKIFKLKPFNDFRGKYLESFNFKKYLNLLKLNLSKTIFLTQKKMFLKISWSTHQHGSYLYCIWQSSICFHK